MSLITSKKNFCLISKIFAILVVLFYFIIIYILNYCTAYSSDDFTYCQSKNIIDVFKQSFYYFTGHNCRLFAHIFCHLFLYLDKSVFNLFNTLIILFINFFVVYFATYKSNVSLLFKTIMFSFSCVATLLLIPTQRTLFWVSGSCNYIFSTFFILLSNIVFIRLLIDTYENDKIDSSNDRLKSKIIIVLLCLLSFIAGISNENSSSTAFLLNLSIVLFLRFNKKRVRLQYYVYLIIFLIGFLILLFGPGTRVRLAYHISQNPTTENIIVQLAERFISISFRLFEQFGILISIYLFLFGFLIFSLINDFSFININKSDNDIIRKMILSIAFFLLFLIANYVLIFSPGAPERAKIVSFFYLLIAIFYLIVIYLEKINISKSLLFSIYLTSLILIFPFSIVVLNSLLYRIDFNNKTEYILECKKNGIMDIMLEENKPTIVDEKDYRIPTCFKSLVRKEKYTKEYSINDSWAEYYGVNSITVKNE